MGAGQKPDRVPRGGNPFLHRYGEAHDGDHEAHHLYGEAHDGDHEGQAKLDSLPSKRLQSFNMLSMEVRETQLRGAWEGEER